MKKETTFSIIIGTLVVALVASVFFIQQRQSQSHKVSATIFPLYDITRNIAGDAVKTELLLPAGASPHTFDPKPSEIRKISGSDALFTIGHGLDTWAANAAESASIAQIITVDTHIALLEGEEEHEHDDHEDEGGDGLDPHYWLSVPNAEVIAENIATVLIALYPDDAATFEQNLANYQAQLQDVHAEIRQEIMQINNPTIATFHSAWNYYADTYGITITTVFEEYPGKEPTAEYLAEFQDLLKETNTTIIFSEPQLSTKPLEPIANDANISISILDPIGGVNGRESYIKLLRFNTNQIVSALQ